MSKTSEGMTSNIYASNGNGDKGDDNDNKTTKVIPTSSKSMLSISDVAKSTADKFLEQSIECFTKVFGEDNSALADVMTTASALKVMDIHHIT